MPASLWPHGMLSPAHLCLDETLGLALTLDHLPLRRPALPFPHHALKVSRVSQKAKGSLTPQTYQQSLPQSLGTYCSLLREDLPLHT